MDDSNHEWESVKARIRVGDELTGRVVQREPFGILVDATIGFLAIIEVVDFLGRVFVNPDAWHDPRMPLGAYLDLPAEARNT